MGDDPLLVLTPAALPLGSTDPRQPRPLSDGEGLFTQQPGKFLDCVKLLHRLPPDQFAHVTLNPFQEAQHLAEMEVMLA